MFENLGLGPWPRRPKRSRPCGGNPRALLSSPLQAATPLLPFPLAAPFHPPPLAGRHLQAPSMAPPSPSPSLKTELSGAACHWSTPRLAGHKEEEGEGEEGRKEEKRTASSWDSINDLCGSTRVTIRVLRWLDHSRCVCCYICWIEVLL